MKSLSNVLCFLPLLALAAANGDASCDGCGDKELTRELEKSNKELSRCRANNLAIETRESIIKEQVVACEEQRKSSHNTAADLQSKLDSITSQQIKDRENFQVERDALLQMVSTLKQSHKELEAKYDTAVQEHRTAIEKQQLRHAQQLELVLSHDTELEAQLETASDKQTSLEESVKSLQQEIKNLAREKHNALADVEKWKSKLSDDQSSCENSLSTIQLQLEQAQKDQETRLADSQSSCESQKQASDERMKARVDELQAIIDRLRAEHENKTKSLQEKYDTTLVEQQRSCEGKVVELQELSQRLDTSMKSKLLETEMSCTRHREDLRRNMTEEIDRARIHGIDIGKNKTSSGLHRLKQLNEKLKTSQRALLEKTDSDASRQQQLKDELFDVRRELFLANEKLREPIIRHRTRMKRIRAVVDSVEAWFAPFHHAYVLPLLIPTQRYVADAVAYFQREHLPGIQARAIYAMDTSRDLTGRSYDGVRRGYDAMKKFDSKRLIDATANERKLYGEAFVRVRSSLYDESFIPFYEQSVKPIVDKHWIPVYRKHVLPLWTSFMDAVSPHLVALGEQWRSALRLYGVARDDLDKKLYFFADVASDYGHVQKYGALAQLSGLIRDSSSGIVRLAESLILGGLAIGILLLVFRRRRPKKVVV